MYYGGGVGLGSGLKGKLGRAWVGAWVCCMGALMVSGWWWCNDVLGGGGLKIIQLF